MAALSAGLAHRLDVASRLLAGIAGGYALAAAATAFLSLSLPLPRGQAVTTATMLSFAVHTAAIVWAFSARRRRVWPGILGPALALAAGAWLLRAGGAS